MCFRSKVRFYVTVGLGCHAAYHLQRHADRWLGTSHILLCAELALRESYWVLLRFLYPENVCNLLPDCSDRCWKTVFFFYLICHGWGGQTSASHCGDPGSISDQCMCHLWWIKWHWDRVLSQYFGFPLSTSFHQCVILHHRRCIIFAIGSSNEAQSPLACLVHGWVYSVQWRNSACSL